MTILSSELPPIELQPVRQNGQLPFGFCLPGRGAGPSQSTIIWPWTEQMTICLPWAWSAVDSIWRAAAAANANTCSIIKKMVASDPRFRFERNRRMNNIYTRNGVMAVIGSPHIMDCEGLRPQSGGSLNGPRPGSVPGWGAPYNWEEPGIANFKAVAFCCSPPHCALTHCYGFRLSSHFCVLAISHVGSHA